MHREASVKHEAWLLHERLLPHAGGGHETMVHASEVDVGARLITW